MRPIEPIESLPHYALSNKLSIVQKVLIKLLLNALCWFKCYAMNTNIVQTFYPYIVQTKLLIEKLLNKHHHFWP